MVLQNEWGRGEYYILDMRVTDKLLSHVKSFFVLYILMIVDLLYVVFMVISSPTLRLGFDSRQILIANMSKSFPSSNVQTSSSFSLCFQTSR